MPSSGFAWESGAWDAEAVRRMLKAAKVKPPFADLEGAALHLEMLARDLAEPAPARPEELRDWAKGARMALEAALHALGAYPAAPSPTAPGLELLAPFAAPGALPGALEGVAIIAAALRKAEAHSAKRSKGAGRTPDHYGRVLAIRCAAAYRAAKGKKKSGAQANGPAVRLALAVFRAVAPGWPAPSAVAIAEHLRADRKGRKARPKRQKKKGGKLPR
jgi:hypothetical protein